jgi:hypothetical protein
MTSGLFSDRETFAEFCATNAVPPGKRDYLLAYLQATASNLENARVLEAKRGDRSMVLDRYDKIMSLLEDLSSSLVRQAPTGLHSALNRLWREPAERFASNLAVAQFAPELRDDRAPRSRRELEMEIERPGHAARRNAEIRHEVLAERSTDLVREFVEQLLSPMKGPREFERQASRGRDPDVARRRLVIHHLMPIYRAVTGREATGGPNSAFVAFLDPILQELGLPVTGLPSAVNSVLKMGRGKSGAF